MPIALGELDVQEVPGDGDNPRILAYHQSTSLAAKDDEVPWCASYVGFCLQRAGITPTGSAMARSYTTWGRAVEPRFGAVAVFRRGAPPSGHVGFVVDEDATRLFLLSGNVGDRVCLTSFPKEKLVACRWPT